MNHLFLFFIFLFNLIKTASSSGIVLGIFIGLIGVVVILFLKLKSTSSGNLESVKVSRKSFFLFYN
jgi:hypothetical protein